MVAATCPQLIFFILGSQYDNLQNELLWIIAMMGVASLMQTIWLLNVSRGWITSLSWNIPLVILVQTVTILALPINTIPGIALMSIFVAIAQTIHAIFAAICGLRSIPSLAEPSRHAS
jgi:hypothetical protein